MPLRTLLHLRKTQLLYFLSIPHSLRKTTRGGGGASLKQKLFSFPPRDPYFGTSSLRISPLTTGHYFLPRVRISGQRAKTEVVRPPRGVNSPRTTHHSGFTAATMSRSILLTAFS